MWHTAGQMDVVGEHVRGKGCVSMRLHVLTAPLKEFLRNWGRTEKFYTNKCFSNKHFSFQKSGNILSKSQSNCTEGQLDWLW